MDWRALYRGVQYIASPNAGLNRIGSSGGSISEDTWSFECVAAEGWRFTGWSWVYSGSADIGSPIPTDNPITFNNPRCDEDQVGGLTLTANFVMEGGGETVTITVSAAPGNGGTVTGGGTYQLGSQFTISATPNPGYRFEYWEGPEGGSDASFTGTALSDADYVAHFVPESTPTRHSVSTFVGTPRGSTSGDGMYAEGASFTIVATPYNEDGTEDPGGERYEFLYWEGSDGTRSENATYTGTMGTSDLVFTAHFKLAKYKVEIKVHQLPLGATFRCSMNTSVDGTGEYWKGETCRLIAGANPGTKLVKFFTEAPDGTITDYPEGEAEFTVTTDLDVYALSLYDEAVFDYWVYAIDSEGVYEDLAPSIVDVTGGFDGRTKLKAMTDINVSLSIAQAYTGQFTLLPFGNGKYYERAGFSGPRIEDISGVTTPNMTIQIVGDTEYLDQYYANHFSDGRYYFRYPDYLRSSEDIPRTIISFRCSQNPGLRSIIYDIKYYAEQFGLFEEEESGMRTNSPSGSFTIPSDASASIEITIFGQGGGGPPPWIFSLQNLTSSYGTVTMTSSTTAKIEVPPATSSDTVRISGMIWHQNDGIILCNKSNGEIICTDDGILCR